jgi:hypothetical protein
VIPRLHPFPGAATSDCASDRWFFFWELHKQHLIDVQESHSLHIRKVLGKSDRVELLEVSYPDLVADPGPVIAQLESFLPGRFTSSIAVTECVKPTLFRNR